MLVCLSWKFFEIRKFPVVSRRTVLEHFIKQFYSFETGKVSLANVMHLIIRAVNFFLMSYLMIVSSHYAMLGQINFGVITSCTCVSAPFNCVLGYLFFGEKMTGPMLGGTALILAGVTWLAIAKGNVIAMEGPQALSEDDMFWNRIYAIGTAVFSGLMSSMRMMQAKYVNKYLKYNPVDFSNDGGLVCGLIIFLFSIYYYLNGQPSYTLYNLGISFIASCFMMITSLVGLICMVNGLVGPTSALV